MKNLNQSELKGGDWGTEIKNGNRFPGYVYEWTIIIIWQLMMGVLSGFGRYNRVVKVNFYILKVTFFKTYEVWCQVK